MRTNLIAALGAIAALSATVPATAQQDIIARDGDRIIVDEDARIQIVRRRQAAVRTIFNQEQRLLIVLLDYSKPGEFPDGQVDWAFNFHEVEGNWPLGERWEAMTNVLQYEGDSPLPRGLALETPQGLVRLLPGGQVMSRPDPSALALLSFHGSSSGGRQGLSFAEAETLQLQDYSRSKASGATVSTLMGDSSSASGTGAAPLTGGIRGPSGAPRKLRNVAPNYPEAARQARVSGVVILQLTVSANGIVTDARVLRSIPLLDAAAIEAAKLWQYEPRPGAPPLTLTAAVPFTP
jgi:TonB family protein